MRILGCQHFLLGAVVFVVSLWFLMPIEQNQVVVLKTCVGVWWRARGDAPNILSESYLELRTNQLVEPLTWIYLNSMIVFF